MKKQFTAAFILVIFLIPFSVWGWGVIGMGGSPGVAWDLLDEDCTDFSTPTWTDDDQGTGVSEISPAGQFRLDTNAGAAGNDFARRTADIGSYPDESTHELRLYHDDIGTEGNSDYFQWIARQSGKCILTRFGSDGLFVSHNGTYAEVGTDLVKEAGSAEWQAWRFLVNFANTTCDIFLNDSTHNWEKVGTAIDCNATGAYTDGETRLTQFGFTTDNVVSHVDYIKAATGLYIP